MSQALPANPATIPAAARRTSRNGVTLPLIAPSVLLLLAWSIIPLVMTLWFSFRHYNLVDPTQTGFAGFDNYIYLLTDPDFWASLINTLVLVGGVLIISVCGGTLLAVLYDQEFLGRGVARLLVIAPFFVMPTVSALVWKNLMLHPDLRGPVGVAVPRSPDRRRSTGSPTRCRCCRMVLHPVVGVAALRPADPADRPAVAGSGAVRGGAHGRRGPARPVLLRHPAPPEPRDRGGDHDGGDLPAGGLRRDLRDHRPEAPVTATTNLAFLIYGRALLQFDVGGASAGGVVAIMRRQPRGHRTGALDRSRKRLEA